MTFVVPGEVIWFFAGMATMLIFILILGYVWDKRQRAALAQKQANTPQQFSPELIAAIAHELANRPIPDVPIKPKE